MFRRRRADEKIFVSRHPGEQEAVPTQAQASVREKFQQAAIYGRSVVSNPETKAEYAAAAKPGQSAYNVAVADFFRAPDIEEVYLSAYSGQVGDLLNIKSSGGLQPAFRKFTEALEKANAQGRLGGIGKLTSTNGKWMEENINGLPFRIEILGPVTSQLEGSVYFKWFDDSSHTRNGHSLVLKLIYGKTSLLFGGDLNELSETHLLKHYGKQNPFLADVAKSCHHGSSEFTVDFLKQVNPYATVISSGDNENYSHPRADAIGSAGKYSRGDKPKVYSTELARSINSAGKILYGMINLRSDGKKIYMAQLKEKRSGADVWDSYEIK